MIVISQGHRKSIGLEIFLKCVPFFNQSFLTKIVLVCNRDDLLLSLNSSHFSFSIDKDKLLLLNRSIQCIFVPNTTNTYDILNYALKLKPSILLTLPTTKSDLGSSNGYTEFFRSYYNNSNLMMGFISPNFNIALLSDHIPLNNISDYLTKDVIIQKVSSLIDFFISSKLNIFQFNFLGINPHAGESGLIGSDENTLFEAINELRLIYPQLLFSNFLPADSFFLFPRFNPNSILISPYHDQILPLFKFVNSTKGIHFTTGLPFKRFSVDHGTADQIYLKDSANYSGMFYLLDFIEKYF